MEKRRWRARKPREGGRSPVEAAEQHLGPALGRQLYVGSGSCGPSAGPVSCLELVVLPLQGRSGKGLEFGLQELSADRFR